MAQNKTTIKTSLPYCLYKVDSRFFKLNDVFDSKIRFIKIETTPNRRTDSSKNMETIRDRWGIDAHSDVEIYTNKIFDHTEKAETFALEIINNFVQRYRYFDRRAVHLVSLSREDFFGFNVFSDGHGMILMSLAGGITPTDPLLVHEISNKVEKSLAENEQIPFYEELLLNSEQYIYQIEYRHSILESVIALELVLSNFILKKCMKKGIPETDAKKYIQSVGITGNIKVTLTLLLDGTPMPNEEVLEKCKDGIEIRNKIVHKGRKDVSKTEAQETLKQNREMIKFLLPLIDPD